MSGAGRWSDLSSRVVSALIMVGVALVALWSGGAVWQGFIALICAAMVYEMARMLAPSARAVAFLTAAVAAVVIFPATTLPAWVVLPSALVPGLVGAAMMRERGRLFLFFASWIALAGFAFITIRADLGLVGMLWLICVVIATDVAGYFAGKAIGGPKFWPRVSPKKTWCGTVAGWIAAALVGAGFVAWSGFGAGMIAVSVLAAFAAQAGDIAESAVKRKVGVKDSSGLIPGHGGFLDRFDGMIGAGVFILLAGIVTGFLPGVL